MTSDKTTVSQLTCSSVETALTPGTTRVVKLAVLTAVLVTTTTHNDEQTLNPDTLHPLICLLCGPPP